MGARKLLPVCHNLVAAILVCCFLLSTHAADLSLPLSAHSHWLVAHPTGSSIKLACVNWASHLNPMIADALHLHPLHSIAHTIASSGFNCVRISYPTSMFTNLSLAEAREAHSFKELGLEEDLQGLKQFNGKLVGMTSVEALKEVVRALGKEGVMVVLNDCTHSRGCDGEADESYNLLGKTGSEAQQERRVQGLQTMAALFKGWPNVVGISFRDELQGAPQEWSRQMQRAAEAIHRENPDLFLFLGGLNSTIDIPVLAKRLLSDALKRKVVYEVRYEASNGHMEGDMEAQYDALMEKMTDDMGLILNTWPLIHGSFYLCGGVRDDDDDVFGLFTHHQWPSIAPRDPLLLHKRQALQLSSTQDRIWHRPPHAVLFHPATRMCLNKVHVTGLQMGSCSKASHWKVTPQGLISLDSTYMVISAKGPGQPAVLALQGLQSNGPWTVSNTAQSARFVHMSTVVSGQTLCLDAPALPAAKLVFTNRCLCSDSSCASDLTSQCFIFVSST